MGLDELIGLHVSGDTEDVGTWEVPAAPCGAASHPAALVHRHAPAVPLVALQCVGREVTHLQLGVAILEALKGHPVEGKKRREEG